MKRCAKHYAKFLVHIIEFSFYNPKKYVLPSPFSEEEILAQSVSWFYQGHTISK